MIHIIESIIDYYSNSEQYKREECLSIPHNEVLLTPDYPYYNQGVRYLSIHDENFTLYLDLSFFNHYSLSELESLGIITFIVVSNELNLSGLVLDINTFYVIDYLFFNIDMSSNVLVNKKNRRLYLNSDLYINWLNSGLSIQLNSYCIVCDLLYKDSNSLFDFYSCFNNYYILDANRKGVNLRLFVDSKSDLYLFITEFKRYLKSDYKKDNSSVHFRMIVCSLDYDIEDSKDDLNSLFYPLFDDFSLAFSSTRN